MFDPICSLSTSVSDIEDEDYSLQDYEGGLSRWCHGCGNNALLTALQKLCADEQLPPEKTVFVSGIGCSSRFPHYMGTYGFHGLHGRALPVAEGIKIRRPDLNVFVNTGDGDCASIGAAHWLHAVRYNMDMTVMLHNNCIYGLTKKQASPTSPRGMQTNTTPRGAYLDPINILETTLGMSNVSFVAHAADWLPGLLHQILVAAFHHRGLSFVIIMQRCPNYLPVHFDRFMKHRENVRLLTHPDGVEVDEALASHYPNRERHDPADIHRARELASDTSCVPLGILYRNPEVPRYEDLRRAGQHLSIEERIAGLEREFDKFMIAPAGATE